MASNSFQIPHENWPLSEQTPRVSEESEDERPDLTLHPLPTIPNEFRPTAAPLFEDEQDQPSRLLPPPTRRISNTPIPDVNTQVLRRRSRGSSVGITGQPDLSVFATASTTATSTIPETNVEGLRREFVTSNGSGSAENAETPCPPTPPRRHSLTQDNGAWNFPSWNQRRSSVDSGKSGARRTSLDAGKAKPAPTAAPKPPKSRVPLAGNERSTKFQQLNSINESDHFEKSEPVSLPPPLQTRPTVSALKSSVPSATRNAKPRGSVSFGPESFEPKLPRRSSAAAAVPPARPQRRGSRLNPFDLAFTRSRQSSQVDPFGQTQSTETPSEDVPDLQIPKHSKSDTNIPKVRRPSQAHVRSKSLAFNMFTNPFGGVIETDAGIPTDDLRRGSAPTLSRRPSQFQRLMSVGGTPHPIPRQYRSKSVSSLGFYLSSVETSRNQLPIFEDDVEAQKENVEEYLAGVEKLQASVKRKPWETKFFQTAYFFIIICVVYFVFIGKPIWPGVGALYYRWVHSAGLGSAGSIIFISWAAFQAFVPMFFARFETELDDVEKRDASETALIIPAYKAANILPETIKAALKIFKPEQIFIMNNGNSPEPADNTAEICKEYGVQHAYVPIGSKITAEFVGIALTKAYKYILLIDDDVHLPANFPLVTDRIKGNTKCIGYTIKSTGENGSKGTLVQQCQNVEYTMSGLGKTFAGKYGSATFPHGAIILWDRLVLQNLFNVHPGYTISEDWFFGHGCRSMGYRIDFCSQVFVETETPPEFLWSSTAARGGFGEMTVFKQRFSRWNYFLGMRIWEDTIYMLFSWRLGFREIVTKFYVTVEIYDSVMSFLRPWVIVLTLISAWRLFFQFFAITFCMYTLAFTIFNGYHLRRKGEMVSWKVLPMYMWMKFVLLYVNCLSVYYGLYSYARFFSVRHPRVIESRAALEAAYNVRLGTRLVPLDTHIGEVGTHNPDEETGEIQVVKEEAALPIGNIFDEKTTVNW